MTQVHLTTLFLTLALFTANNRPSAEATEFRVVVWPFDISPKTHATTCLPLPLYRLYSYITDQCFPFHILLLRNVIRLLVTANVVPSSPILVTLVMEAISSSEMSVLTRAQKMAFLKKSVSFK
jgi:hypothetical protein